MIPTLQLGQFGQSMVRRAYRDTVLADNPLIYYRMNEPSGTTAANLGSLSSTFDGTIAGSPTLSASGLIAGADTAISFDGTNDVVSSIESATLGTASGSTRSIEFWFKTTTTSFFTLAALRGTGGVSADSLVLGVMNLSGPNRISIVSGGTTVLAAPDDCADGRAFHVWVGVNGATNAVTFYLNGALVGTATGGSLSAANLKLSVGANIFSPSTFGQFATAVIDELAVYSFIPSAAQALAHYSAGRNP